MSNLNDQISMSDINTILNKVQEAYNSKKINSEQFNNILKTFNDVLNLVINSNSSVKPEQSSSEQTTTEAPISGGFLNKLMLEDNSENIEETSISTLNYNEDDTIDQEISLKGGYDYLYNPSKKNKFTPTASYHAKKTFTSANNALDSKIQTESNSLTGGTLNNYFNKLIESTLKNKKVKGGDFEDEIDGGKKRKTKKKKTMKGGEDEFDDLEKETEDNDELEEKNSDDEKPNTNIDIDEDSNAPPKKEDEEVNVKEESEEKLDKIIDSDDDDDDDEIKEDVDEIFEGGKSQLQPYHDKIVENITKYLDKYEPELEGEDKVLRGKQIKRLLNVLYYKSDENTSMEDRIKQLEDIGEKTSTEAKLKKIITGNKDELQSIIDSWVKAEPKKKKKSKKPKTFDNEESIEIKSKKSNDSASKSDNSDTSIDGGIVNTASMIDSVIMGGKKKNSLKRNLFNY